MFRIARFTSYLLLIFMIQNGLFLATSRAMETAEPPSSWFIDMSRLALSAHSSLSCESCHGTMKEQDRLHPDSQNTRFLKQGAFSKYDYKRCQTCHRLSYDRTLQGAHAKALKKESEGNTQQVAIGKVLPENTIKAPTCGDCHSSHYEKAHRNRLEIGRQQTERCGSCHPAQKVTYLENYHGKAAVNLGKTSAAFCTDCHGAHNCLSLKDKQKALEACQRCHPKASLSFAGQVIHPNLPSDTKTDPEKAAKVTVIKLVTLLMGTMVIIVVVFFYGHSFLWLLREIHEKLRRPK